MGMRTARRPSPVVSFLSCTTGLLAIWLSARAHTGKALPRGRAILVPYHSLSRVQQAVRQLNHLTSAAIVIQLHWEQS